MRRCGGSSLLKAGNEASDDVKRLSKDERLRGEGLTKGCEDLDGDGEGGSEA